MVSLRCKMVLKSELESLGFHATLIELGEADIEEILSDEDRERLKIAK